MDVLEKFKKFESRSRSAFSELHENMKNDRMFMAGNTQWTKDDDSFVETTRNRITMNVIANQCHSVANSYSSFAYTWITGKPEIDREVDEFFKVDSNRYASEEALLGTVSFGLSSTQSRTPTGFSWTLIVSTWIQVTPWRGPWSITVRATGSASTWAMNFSPTRTRK